MKLSNIIEFGISLFKKIFLILNSKSLLNVESCSIRLIITNPEFLASFRALWEPLMGKS